jgi:hypothetical protein
LGYNVNLKPRGSVVVSLRETKVASMNLLCWERRSSSSIDSPSLVAREHACNSRRH